GGTRPVWRVSMAPSEAHHMVMALRMEAAVDAFYDWQGGLVWLSMREDDPEADLLRGLIRKHGGGHATLVRASAPHLAALSTRLKAEFDPKNILNPGRMAPGSGSATLARSTQGAAS
ncbi:MAG: 2-hydroxy-acid oxidase, partial [Mesorhizobium sp.]